MAKYKVTNLDAPIEADYWVDIPIRDPDTNKDMVDDEGRIQVKRYVTRTVKQKEYQSIVDKVPTYDNLVTSYNTYVTENNKQVKLISEMATTATNNVTKLTETVNNHDSQIHALYTKINAIQGIDIDDFKLVTETNIKNIKNSYLPLTGGTLSNSLTIQGTNAEVQAKVYNPSTGSLCLYANKTAKGLYALGTNNAGINLATVNAANVVTFNGSLNGNATSATKASNDSSNRNIVNTYALKSNYPDRIKLGWDTTLKGYVNLTVDVTTWGLITTANIGSQSVSYATSCNKANSATTAQKANSADYATNCTNAVNATKATTATTATIATTATTATNATYAASAGSATKATQDGAGATITNTYVKLAAAQTISAQHNFSKGVKISGYLVTIG